MSEQDVIEAYPSLDFECDTELSRPTLGDRVCWSDVARFNGVPAKEIAFFFVDNKLAKIRLALLPQTQPELVAYLDHEFRKLGITGTTNGREVGSWLSPAGLIGAYAGNDPPPKEAMLLWNSFSALGKDKNPKLVELMRSLGELAATNKTLGTKSETDNAAVSK